MSSVETRLQKKRKAEQALKDRVKGNNVAFGRRGMGGEAGAPGSLATYLKETFSIEKKRRKILKGIRNIRHACECRDTFCRRFSCPKVKRAMEHTKTCREEAARAGRSLDCHNCTQFIALCCYHTKVLCEDPHCPMPNCTKTKQIWRRKFGWMPQYPHLVTLAPNSPNN